jgi:hypothetical protein
MRRLVIGVVALVSLTALPATSVTIAGAQSPGAFHSPIRVTTNHQNVCYVSTAVAETILGQPLAHPMTPYGGGNDCQYVTANFVLVFMYSSVDTCYPRPSAWTLRMFPGVGCVTIFNASPPISMNGFNLTGTGVGENVQWKHRPTAARISTIRKDLIYVATFIARGE